MDVFLPHAPVRRKPGGPELPTLALRPREAAAALGISESTLDRLTRSGAVPVVKIGRVRTYRVEALNAYLAGHETVAEVRT
jgi:excisionase family DNA binding protein